jgi:hypothetical protein
VPHHPPPTQHPVTMSDLSDDEGSSDIDMDVFDQLYDEQFG